MQDFDLIVIGAGVAGLTAAMIAGRYGLRVAVVDQMGIGGQIAPVEKIENFPGFPQGIGGFELGPLLHEQAEAAGAVFMLDTVESLQVEGRQRIVRGALETLQAPAVLIAAGSAQRSLGVPGEAMFAGKGVSHCASCDGPLFQGQTVGVAGGGDSALDEALVLAGHAAKVIIFHRGPSLDAQQALVARAKAVDKIEIVLHTLVEEIIGERTVTSVRLRDMETEATRMQPIDGLFIYVGQEPNTAFVRGLLRLDSGGHIETDIMMRASVDGVFAAGDIRKNSVAQLASAVGDGATAAISAFRYLNRGD